MLGPGPHRNPLSTAAKVLIGVGAVGVVGLGGYWLYQQTAQASAPPPGALDPLGRPYPDRIGAQQRDQYDQLARLAAVTDNDKLDPARAPMEEITLELQLTLGVDPADGQWSPQTSAAVAKQIEELLAEPRSTNPAADLEPEGADWEQTYLDALPDALAQCCADPRVVTFDQAVIVVLDVIFPDADGFGLRPSTGAWKRSARERARQDLARMLGPTEADARAVLNARTAGAEAIRQGADVGQAVRLMGVFAFPSATWGHGAQEPWQTAFSRRAASELQQLDA